jgi:hypothetical protein
MSEIPDDVFDAMSARRWMISGSYPSNPGTGGVYVEGPRLEPGELVTVIETPESGDTMSYTSSGRRVLKGGHLLAEVPDAPNANETAGLIASALNGYDADEKLLDEFVTKALGRHE